VVPGQEEVWRARGKYITGDRSIHISQFAWVEGGSLVSRESGRIVGVGFMPHANELFACLADVLVVDPFPFACFLIFRQRDAQVVILGFRLGS
jgi:hypothetical protein